MVICGKCGAENALGRVFCGKCGAKLDTAAVRPETIARAGRRNPLLKHWPKLLWVLLGAACVCAGLAFWPRLSALGESGTRPAGKDLQRRLDAAARLPPGSRLVVTLSEQALNGYIEHFKLPDLKADGYSVALEPGLVHARLVRTLGPYTLGDWALAPAMSWDLWLTPVGGRLLVRRASIGHLGVAGPLRTAVARRFAATVGGDPQWRAWTPGISRIEIDDGEVRLTVER
jgi:hypothetical protein